MDGRNFFASDVMRSAFSGLGSPNGNAVDETDPSSQPMTSAAVQPKAPRRP
jgi:hypothetical protein